MRFLRRSLITLSILLTLTLLILWPITYRNGIYLNLGPAGALIMEQGKCIYINAELADNFMWGFAGDSLRGLDWRKTRTKFITFFDNESMSNLGPSFEFQLLAWRAKSFLGFLYRMDTTAKLLAIPDWFLALLTAIPALLWLRPPRRKRPGLCPTCNYDLRASKTRCPECGTAFPDSSLAPKGP